MIDYKLIGARIKAQRNKQKLTQDQLAEMVNITTVYLSRIENGHAKPTLEVYAAICEALKCDLANIFCAVSMESESYQCERVLDLFRSCAPNIKPIALNILEIISKI